MFSNITINLSGPICKCEERNLAWSIVHSNKTDLGIHGLVILCNTCGVEFTIPPKELVARFNLKTPYPGKSATKPNLFIIKEDPNNKNN